MVKGIQYIIIFSVVFFSGCSFVKGTGKVAWGVTKAGTKVAWKAAKLAGKGVKTTVHMIEGKTVVPLRKQGNGMLVKVRLNRTVYTELLVDTGASRTQISVDLAKRLGVDFSKSEAVMVRVADGRVLEARQVYLKELRIGHAVVKNVPAVIFINEQQKDYDGLLGMTFLNNFIFQIDSKKGELILRKRVD